MGCTKEVERVVCTQLAARAISVNHTDQQPPSASKDREQNTRASDGAHRQAVSECNILVAKTQPSLSRRVWYDTWCGIVAASRAPAASRAVCCPLTLLPVRVDNDRVSDCTATPSPRRSLVPRENCRRQCRHSSQQGIQQHQTIQLHSKPVMLATCNDFPQLLTPAARLT